VAGGGEPQASDIALRDAPSSPTRRLIDLFPERAGHAPEDSEHRPAHHVVEHGGGGRPTSFIFGVFHFDEERANPLLAALPAVLHIRNDHGGAVTEIADTLDLVVRETSEQRPGADTVIRHLTDVLFIQIIRAFIGGLREEDQEVCNAIGANWLRALSDPQIMKALALIHEHPGKSWTVASLAAEIGMSRSSFATRFTESVGEPPLAYVTRCRLLKAVESMRESGAAQSLSEIALATGDESDAAFSKAFKRLFGHSPGAFRRAMKASLAATGNEAGR
jgi:AraC-like DNA-binding protein